jgi:murein L,D-transpeptidase YcbB/YkuD
MNRFKSVAAFATVLLAVVLWFPGDVMALDPMQEELSGRIEELQYAETPAIGETSLAALPLITEFYARRDFGLAWTNPDTVDEFIGIISKIDEVGLDPEDYNLAQLRRLIANVRGGARLSREERANLDILLTESFARLGYHLRFGKVNPEDLDPNWNLSRSLDGRDPAMVIQAAIDSGSLATFIAERVEYLPFYEQLKTYLAKYRDIAERGGWPIVPPGPTLKPGMRDPRVVAVRGRLEASGDLERGQPASEEFDEALEQAVIRFQQRHRLDADGVIGKQTLEELNVPAEDRIDQIRVNLERVRWVFRDIEDYFIVVNIAGFEVFVIKDRKTIWRSRAQVGKPYRRTPVFKSSMKYLVFNPTWTVPPGILRKDVLPAVRKDPGYLKKKNMNVIDGDGRVVDPGSIDWSSGRFPYQIRQEPGTNNALGRVKFIFPNKYFVFLHDTPSRGLFDREQRTFSSGCIRVEHPLELAELLLDDSTKWNAESIAKVLESGKTQTVMLAEPLTVLLLYWTIQVDQATGDLHFLRDPYDRDGQILEGLDGDFIFRPLEDPPAYARGVQ